MAGNKMFDMQKILPYIIAIVIFITVASIYFIPVLEGKKISASDDMQFIAMSKELIDYREKTGQEVLWTNNMFSGMPGYLISTLYTHNLLRYIHTTFLKIFGSPIGRLILYSLGFYLLLLSLGVNKWLSISGALAFAFSSYFFIIMEAGHGSKADAIAYMAPVLAGVIMTYRGKYIVGSLVTLFFLALEIQSGHPQITYYLMYMIVVYAIVELIRHYRQKILPAFVKSSALLIVSAIIALLTHTASLWNTYEYSKYSIRGKTELTSEKENRTSGLDKDYATAWSYGIAETMTLLIPNFHGGSSHSELGENSSTYEVLTQNRVPNASQIVQSLPMYWGPQPFTSGPVYAGAIMVFLFIFSLFYLKGPLKWWGIAVTLISITLSWGKNFMPLTDFFLEYIPLYNKFRAVAMILVIAELSIPLLGILAIDQLTRDKEKKKAFGHLKWALYITGGIILIFILFAGSLFSFSSPSDSRMGLPDWLINAIITDRKIMLRNDAIRSLVFILLTFGLLWAYIQNKLQFKYLLIVIPVLILADMWPVNKRYLNNKDFERKSKVENPYQASRADLAILNDSDIYYRVYNINEAFDQSARTSYFHKNIGGYHGAKLRRYQELIDMSLSQERNLLAQALGANAQGIEQALSGASAFNMLNTKYFIINNNSEPLENPFACGNVWFVKNFRIVDNADEEIAAIHGLRPSKEAVVDKRFESHLAGFSAPQNVRGIIKLISYAPNRLVYESSSQADELAIFSEVYYDKGWNAYLDGNKVPHFRANYILRAMLVPAGDHRVEFRFEPTSYYTGQKISLASSLILILLLAGYFAKQFFDRRKAG